MHRVKGHALWFESSGDVLKVPLLSGDKMLG